MENKILFVTAPGHAFNFAMDLAARKRKLEKQGISLPEFSDIVEMDPKQAFDQIWSQIAIAGNKVFVHESLFKKNIAVKFMPSGLDEGQRNKLRFVDVRVSKDSKI